MKVDFVSLERKSGELIKRIIDSNQQALIAVYECQIVRLEEQKVSLSEKIKACGRPLASFDETFRTAITFLANPCKIWENGSQEGRRLVLRLAFARKLPMTEMRAFEPPI